MGCDGGTIPKRHELVKGPKKVEKVNDLAIKTSLCRHHLDYCITSLAMLA